MFNKHDARINGILGRSCLLTQKLKVSGFWNQLAASPCKLPDTKDLTTIRQIEQFEEIFGASVVLDYSGPIGGKYGRNYCGFAKIDDKSIRIVLVQLVVSNLPGFPVQEGATIHNRTIMEGTLSNIEAESQDKNPAEPCDPVVRRPSR